MTQPMLAEDPWLIWQASKADRLFLTRTVGSYSGGTRVYVVGADDKYEDITVRPALKGRPTEQLKVTLDDLVIRRKRS